MSIATRVAASAAMTLGSLAGMAVTSTAASATTNPTYLTGYDISYPQCPSSFPPATGSFDILGVNDGIVYSANPCLGSEYQWAASSGAVSFYVNTANPGPTSSYWPAGQSVNGKTCVREKHYQLGANYYSCSYIYGWNAAANSFNDAKAVGASAGSAQWWLDIESANSWTRSTAANIADIQGALDYFATNTTAGSPTTPGSYTGSGYVGIYTNSSSWSKITGSTTSFNKYPSWLPDQYGSMGPAAACTGYPSVTGGHIRYTQYPNQSWDGDDDCG